MKLSTKGRYAVMAMVDLAHNSNGDPVALAEVIYQTHAQPKNCWTFEVDLRAWSEPFM